MTNFIKRRYPEIVVLLVSISLAVATLALALQANKRSEQKFCAIADSFVAVYKETPPITEAGKRNAENWEYLRSYELRCPTKQEDQP